MQGLKKGFYNLHGLIGQNRASVIECEKAGGDIRENMGKYHQAGNLLEGRVNGLHDMVTRISVQVHDLHTTMEKTQASLGTEIGRAIQEWAT